MSTLHKPQRARQAYDLVIFVVIGAVTYLVSAIFDLQEIVRQWFSALEQAPFQLDEILIVFAVLALAALTVSFRRLEEADREIARRLRAENELTEHQKHLEETIAARTQVLRESEERYHHSETRVRYFAQRLLTIREEEKKNLSMVLHHEVGSVAVGLTARLEGVECQLSQGNTAGALKAVAEAEAVLHQAVIRLKDVAVGLRPPGLDTLGLTAALKLLFSQMTAAPGLQVDFQCRLDELRLGGDLATVLFRVVQEATTNTLKHGHARTLRVALEDRDDTVCASICDDGVGFVPDAALDAPGTHTGLTTMREMVAAVGGTLELQAATGQGTRITLSLPRAKPADRGAEVIAPA